MINNFLYKYSFKIGHLMVTKSFKSIQLMKEEELSELFLFFERKVI